MTAVKTFEPKQPSEQVDYDISFANWLADRADTAASFVAFVTVLSEPADVVGDQFTIVSAVLLGGTVVRVFVAGGKPGGRYKVTARLTTSNVPPRMPEADIIIPVREG